MAALMPSKGASRSICSTCRRQMQLSLSRRTFVSTAARQADPFSQTRSPNAAAGQTTSGARSTSRATSPVLDALDKSAQFESLYLDAASENLDASNVSDQPHRLHVYAHKHNTHITFTQPPKSAARTISSSVSSTSASAADKAKIVDVLLSMSTGNLGFKKGGRGSYDAAYQLGAFVMKQIQERGMLRDVHKLEVVLRGWGAGREAVSKILLGTEGRMIRDRITAVMDSTRLKFGGPRSPKPRRLG